ncbi:MAG: ROK family protein [Candidatus Aminicenantes bacterium]|nr:ROK family protein [Candidatus Aminicenantes bacterium]
MTTEAIIGVDLGGTKVSLGKVQKNRIIKHTTSDISAEGSEEQILGEIIKATEEIFDPGVAGIGVGVPSVVDVERGIVYEVQNIASWKEVPLKEILENHFHKPVYVNNDANCFAVGEKHFGKGKEYSHFVGVTLGTGLGAGIIINNRLYCGPNCGAGEFGSIPYKKSILEHYCGGQFFMSEHGIRGEQVHAMAKQGDKTALEIFEQFGTHMGEAMMIIMFAVDPEAIILGGAVAHSFSFFEKSMWERMKTFPYQHAVERLVIEVTDQPQIAILGAAALYYDAQLR